MKLPQNFILRQKCIDVLLCIKGGLSGILYSLVIKSADIAVFEKLELFIFYTVGN